MPHKKGLKVCHVRIAFHHVFLKAALRTNCRSRRQDAKLLPMYMSTERARALMTHKLEYNLQYISCN